MKVVLASQADGGGGAFRATRRLHVALVQAGIDSRLDVDQIRIGDWRVSGPLGRWSKLAAMARPQLEAAAVSVQKTSDLSMHTAAVVPGSAARRLAESDAEVLNLHWVAGGYLSVRQIGRLRKPIVWTLHDMWAFCGAEHFASVGPEARWRDGYRRGNPTPGHHGPDVDRWTWSRKKHAWRRPLHLVTPSEWLASCARSSALMANWPVTTIPSPLPMDTYRSYPKPFAREALGLPLDVPLILFGALGGTRDDRKGWSLLAPALKKVVEGVSTAEAVIFGEPEPHDPPRLGLPIHWLGRLHDDLTLALAYNAADVMVVPSKLEVLPQTGTEAQAVGTPVVAFDTEGLADVVEHRRTGYLATPFEPGDLAAGIRWVLEDPDRRATLSSHARDRALQLWAPDVVASQYLRVYEQAIEEQAPGLS